jgi:hypothetical protein
MKNLASRLAHTLKKLGSPEDAAEFMRCLNSICREDRGGRQIIKRRPEQTANLF